MKSIGAMPRCRRCKRPSVLVVCRDCHTCEYTVEEGETRAGDPIRSCPVCYCKVVVATVERLDGRGFEEVPSL